MTLLNLTELGLRLRKVDRQLIQLFSMRMRLALQVEEYKRQNHEQIFRSDVEDRRLAEAEGWAKDHGLNPHFARAILYSAINESCKVQLIQLQKAPNKEPEQEDDEQWYAYLKENLLKLTQKIAVSYDERYDSRYFATHAYLEYEAVLIGSEIGNLEDTSLAIDLGCATGNKSFKLVRIFDEVVGYDISPEMVVEAEKKRQLKIPRNSLRFEIADIENGIPQPDGVVSFIVMNLGTAGDVRNIEGVLRDIYRVLKPGGKAFLSFYNRDALIYRLEFIPWPLGLAAEINLRKNCLEVHTPAPDSETFFIYARPYTRDEVLALIRPTGLLVTHLSTYPAIISMLPNDLYEDENLRVATKDIDDKLTDSNLGAYIVVVVERQ